MSSSSSSTFSNSISGVSSTPISSDLFVVPACPRSARAVSLPARMPFLPFAQTHNPPLHAHSHSMSSLLPPFPSQQNMTPSIQSILNAINDLQSRSNLPIQHPQMQLIQQVPSPSFSSYPFNVSLSPVVTSSNNMNLSQYPFQHGQQQISGISPITTQSASQSLFDPSRPVDLTSLAQLQQLSQSSTNNAQLQQFLLNALNVQSSSQLPNNTFYTTIPINSTTTTTNSTAVEQQSNTLQTLEKQLINLRNLNNFNNFHNLNTNNQFSNLLNPQITNQQISTNPTLSTFSTSLTPFTQMLSTSTTSSSASLTQQLPTTESSESTCSSQTYPCSHSNCDQVLRSKFSLKRHMKKHTGEKAHTCPFDNCTRTFRESTALKRHLRIHTGEKPYQCSYCIKQFADATNVKRHEMTHTNEKPYTCLYQTCLRSFSRRSSLRTHMMSLHNINTDSPIFIASLHNGNAKIEEKLRQNTTQSTNTSNETFNNTTNNIALPTPVTTSTDNNNMNSNTCHLSNVSSSVPVIAASSSPLNRTASASSLGSTSVRLSSPSSTPSSKIL